jgi:hypothetical protein
LGVVSTIGIGIGTGTIGIAFADFGMAGIFGGATGSTWFGVIGVSSCVPEGFIGVAGVAIGSAGAGVIGWAMGAWLVTPPGVGAQSNPPLPGQ